MEIHDQTNGDAKNSIGMEGQSAGFRGLVLIPDWALVADVQIDMDRASHKNTRLFRTTLDETARSRAWARLALFVFIRGHQ
jgi:hypothetical protein